MNEKAENAMVTQSTKNGENEKDFEFVKKMHFLEKSVKI
jgi:hypothetical protein